jgi:hypothetical protein
MGSHIVNGKFQSDKYPTCPAGKVPLSVEDPMAQDLLYEYAQRRRNVDAEFSADLETALKNVGYEPPQMRRCTCGVGDDSRERHRMDCAKIRSVLERFHDGQVPRGSAGSFGGSR